MCDNTSTDGSTGRDNAMKFFFLLKVNGLSKLRAQSRSMQRKVGMEVAVFSSEPLAMIRKGEGRSLSLHLRGFVYLSTLDKLEGAKLLNMH